MVIKPQPKFKPIRSKYLQFSIFGSVLNTDLILGAHQANQSIAKLAEEGWDRAMLEKFLVLKGLNKMDNEVLLRVCKYRGI